MKNLLIIYWAVIIGLSTLNSQQCISYDRWNIDDASVLIALADIALDGVADCQSPDDRQICYEAYNNLMEADDHLHQVMIGNIKNNCLMCKLDNALNVAYNLDAVSKKLYQLNYSGRNSFDRNISLEMEQWFDDQCPDISGTYYPTNHPSVVINITYDNINDVFVAELIDGSIIEYSYLQIINSELVQIVNASEVGRIWNDGNNIMWSNHEWVKINDQYEGFWRMDEGDVIKIVKTANGQYSLYLDKLVALSRHTSKFNPGDFFGEIWTEDHVHFKGYIVTKEPTLPQADIFLRLDSGILYIDDTNRVFNDLSKAGRLTKI